MNVLLKNQQIVWLSGQSLKRSTKQAAAVTFHSLYCKVKYQLNILKGQSVPEYINRQTSGSFNSFWWTWCHWFTEGTQCRTLDLVCISAQVTQNTQKAQLSSKNAKKKKKFSHSNVWWKLKESCRWVLHHLHITPLFGIHWLLVTSVTWNIQSLKYAHVFSTQHQVCITSCQCRAGLFIQSVLKQPYQATTTQHRHKLTDLMLTVRGLHNITVL